MVDDDTVAFALELIERSGVARRAEESLARSTGRPRSVPVVAVLVALLCLAMDHRPLLLTSVTELLWRRLSDDAKQKLGITGEATGRKRLLARYRCVRYCFHAVASTVDPSSAPRNRCAVRTADKAPEPFATDARKRLEELVNSLVEASASVLDDDEREAFGGDVGLDATPVALYSRGPSRRSGGGASDPDGGWYVRKGDARDRDEAGSGRTKVVWALEVTMATMARSPGAAPDHPNLVLGLALGRPGEDPGGTGTRVLASVVARGHKPGRLGADRAYTAALPERFHLPARALGYTLVMDYRIDQLGVQANSGGALLVEGGWYCPSMPATLVAATQDYRRGAIDEITYRERIAARAPFRLKRKEGPDVDGYERLGCPALGNHPALMCPLRERSMTPHDGRTKVLSPPQDPPRICAQQAVTIAPDVGARWRQDLPFASDQWARSYATMRNSIEGLNGFVKDPAHEALSEAGRRRVRGIAAQSIFCAFLVMAANLRKVRAFRDIVAAGGAEAVAERARRRRTRLGDFRPDA